MRLRVPPSIVTVAGMVVLAASLGGAVGYWHTQRQLERQVVYVIPPGTVERLEAGEAVDVLPATIELTLGRRDVLVIRNDDSRPVTIGPFKVAPGQQFTQRYHNAGTYDLICSIHPGEQLRVVVSR